MRSFSLITSLAILTGLTVAVAQADDIKCERGVGSPEKSLQGQEVWDNGEIVKWESRIDLAAEGVWRFSYCVENHRKYNVVTINWVGEEDRQYFTGVVPPLSERGTFRETVQPGYLAAIRTLKVDSRELKPETIVSDETVAAPKALELRSQATFDVAIDPEVAKQLANYEYGAWNVADFQTVTLDFTSKATPKGEGVTQVINQLKVSMPGNNEQAAKFLNAFPLELVPYGTQTKLQDFWGIEANSIAIDRVAAQSLPEAYKEWTGPIEEFKAVIRIGVGKNNYASFPVSYLSGKNL